MYLKSIEVQGFKSFANKIIFEFHNGITGIVGPNGSGKSNVSDAVRWVLGEQSAKQLRGGNMQDVIFSGTETRKPLGFASVAITLDNSDHKLPIEYEEVTVTRRLYRSGESEYLLNGTACRLKDINELFYDTGIGKEGYSIIGQGQIDKILSGKPEERRELFDEAAGIVKFKRRKASALKKLEEEQQNLVRVTDILSELTRQLGPLERQSETARIYLKKKEELKLLDVNLFLIEMERVALQIKETEEKQDTAENQLKDLQQQFEKTKEEYERLEKNLEELEERTAREREASGQNALAQQQMEGQIRVLEEQIHTVRTNDQHYQNRKDAIREELLHRRKEMESCLQQKEELLRQLDEVQGQQKEQKETVEKLQQEASFYAEQAESAKNEIIEILNGRASTKGKLQRYDAMLEQIQIRKAELASRQLQMKGDENKQTETLKNYQAEYEAVSRKMEESEEEYRKIEQQAADLKREIDERHRQLEVGQTAYHREASRLESLKNITERYDGYGNSIRRIMEQKDRNPGILGVVADLIKTQKKYETAIETALGGSIQNIVTDNESTAKYLIEFLKRNKAGRATFLPLTSMQRRGGFSQPQALKEEGVLGLASTLVTAEKRYDSLVEHLLGKTVVVDTIDHAILLARKFRQSLRIVTLEGESLSPGGSMTGGAFRSSSNLLGRRREIEELESSVKRLKKEMEEAQSQVKEKRAKRNQLRDQLVEVSDRLQGQKIRQNTAKINMQQARQKAEELEGSYRKLRMEAAEIEGQIREITFNRKEIEAEMESSREEEKRQEEKALESQKQLDERREQEQAESQKLEEIRLHYQTVAQQAGFLQENMGRLRQEEEKLHQEEAAICQEMEGSGSRLAEKEEQIRILKDQIAEAGRQAQCQEEKLAELAREKEEMSAHHKGFFARREALSRDIAAMDKECFRLGSQMERLEETKETQVNYMWEEYELTPSAAKEMELEERPERSEIKRQIGELRDGIRKLGSVNVNAIEEYKEVSERHAFLSGQYTDLVKAAETLKDIIAELDEGMRRQFTEKFREIQIEFDKVFKQLFGGGRGTLELIEEEDVLEAGIRIISQPPGKKLQNMMQLSGGEKALTAIALLFAIQNLKPSPFCLLDEIEAALDDSNVTRFAKYLHKLTKNTQFIVITHRRGTMNAADRLYGITMQEKGVSTLVSVNLIEHDLDK